jgi:mannosyltransferase
MNQSRKCYLILIIFLTIIGALLRLFHISNDSFWLDEAMTAIFTNLSFIDYWTYLVRLGDVHPPLFYLLEKIPLFFGHAEIHYRIFPAIFGILTIPVFYMVGEKLFNRDVGLIMAILLTFSKFHIFYSQDARMYTMLLFLISIAFYFYIEAINDDRLLSWLSFGIFSSFAIWTHFLAILIISVLLGYALLIKFYKLRPVQEYKNVAILLGLIFCLSIPLLLIAKDLFLVRTSSGYPLWGSSGFYFLIEILISFTTNYPEEIFLLSILFLLGALWLFYDSKSKFIFVFSILVTVTVLFTILSYYLNMMPRYLIMILPLVYGIIGYSSIPLIKKFNKKFVISGFLFIIIIINLPQLFTYYSVPTHQDWRGTSSYLKEVAEPGDILVIMPGYNYPPFQFYYDNSTYGTFESFISSKLELEEITKIKGNLTPSVYILYTNDLIIADPNREILRWMDNNTIMLKDFNGVFIKKYEKVHIPETTDLLL